MPRTTFIPFIVILCLGVTNLSLATTTPTIELEQSVHFLTPGGEDVVVEQGRYEVGQASEWLHLTPVGGEKTDAILVEAQPIDHEEMIEVPTILSHSEHEDAYVILLLLPDGTGLEALGSYSGVRSKAVRRFSRRPRAARSSNQGLRSAKSVRPTAEVTPDPSLNRPARAISPSANKKRQIRRRTQPDGSIGTTPNQGADSKPNVPGVGPIPGPPTITGAGLQPDKKIGWVAPKLAPGGTIVIFGKNFGTRQGKVRLRVDPSHFPEYPGGVPLKITSWSDTKVMAKIPSPMTGPIFSVNVAIRLTRVNPVKTDEYIKAFQVPVETKLLLHTDPGVRTLSCDSKNCLPRGGAPVLDLTFFGKTLRAPIDGAGGLYGLDIFSFDLSDGWVVSKATIHREISGDDGDYVTDPKPAIKAGSDHWSGSVGWYVSYDDNISYKVKVEVMRAKGAY
jgi:hypothetical protein